MNQSELSKAFTKQQQQLGNFFSNVHKTKFFVAQSGKWSPAEHVGHLTLTLERMAFGFTQKDKLEAYAVAPRSYETIQKLYRSTLEQATAAGFLVDNPFAAKLEEGATQKAIVTDFARASQALRDAFNKWSDEELDGLGMQHPLIGLLSAREMLYFCLIHNAHHWHGVRGF